ncbi:MAG: hypothetical protein LBH90_04615 [Tannerella sp.]|jgi:hypothetical protein|nr:hypothetical protein [Tannerella sp.]
MEKEFAFESIKKKAQEQLKSCKSLLGKDGAFAPLLENILKPSLEGDMDVRLDEQDTHGQLHTDMGLLSLFLITRIPNSGLIKNRLFKSR